MGFVFFVGLTKLLTFEYYQNSEVDDAEERHVIIYLLKEYWQPILLSVNGVIEVRRINVYIGLHWVRSITFGYFIYKIITKRYQSGTNGSFKNENPVSICDRKLNKVIGKSDKIVFLSGLFELETHACEQFFLNVK